MNVEHLMNSWLESKSYVMCMQSKVISIIPFLLVMWMKKKKMSKNWKKQKGGAKFKSVSQQGSNHVSSFVQQQHPPIFKPLYDPTKVKGKSQGKGGKGKGGKGKGNGKRHFEPICFKCQQPGHYANKCKVQTNPANNSSSVDGSIGKNLANVGNRQHGQGKKKKNRSQNRAEAATQTGIDTGLATERYHHLTVNHDESNFKDQVKLQIYISQDPKLQFPVEVFKADTQIARIEEILDRLQAKSGKRIDSSIADANVVPKVNASKSSRSKLDQEDDYKNDVFAAEMERECLYAISKYLSAVFEG